MHNEKEASTKSLQWSDQKLFLNDSHTTQSTTTRRQSATPHIKLTYKYNKIPKEIYGVHEDSITFRIYTPPRDHAQIFDHITFTSAKRQLVLNLRTNMIYISNQFSTKPTSSKNDITTATEDKFQTDKYILNINDISNIHALSKCVLVITINTSTQEKNRWHELDYTILPHDNLSLYSVGATSNKSAPTEKIDKIKQPNNGKVQVTFDSVYQAALFQYYIECSHACSYYLKNMYSALQLSEEGIEFDVFRRCFSSFPPLYSTILGLEYLLQKQNQDYVSNHEDGLIVQAAASESFSKIKTDRQKIGYTDFFSCFALLFCPLEPSSNSTIDKRESMLHYWNRLETFMKLRKCCASASLFVRDYCNAMTIVQKSWILKSDTQEYLQKRDYFDNDTSNVIHDISAKNEYYEGIVGYDISIPDLSSTYQEYTLVSSHWIRNYSTQLSYQENIIKMIPSLKKLLGEHSKHEFLVISSFSASTNLINIMLFVRSKPKHLFTSQPDIDLQELTLFLQLGPTQFGISYLLWILIHFYCYLFLVYHWFSSSSSSEIISQNQQHTRTVYAGIPIVQHFDTHTNNEENYHAINIFLDSESISNLFLKMIFHAMDQSSLQNNVVDFTFTTRTRVLGTCRNVHVDPYSVAIPFYNEDLIKIKSEDKSLDMSIFQLEQSLFIEDSNSNNISSIIEFIFQHKDLPQLQYETELKALEEILSDVTVPVRVIADSLISKKLSRIPVLHNMTPYDLQRFYIGSDHNLKTAALNIVTTQSWRNITFPIDTRTCKVELESGQCFSLGKCRKGFPIIYFRNMLKGAWRHDVDASILATLYRIEWILNEYKYINPMVKFTVVILAHRPFYSISNQAQTQNNLLRNLLFKIDHNPRVSPKEEFTQHTNISFIQRISNLLIQHYPERFDMVYIVRSSSKEDNSSHGLLENTWKQTKNKVVLRNIIVANTPATSERIKRKICFLDSYKELEERVVDKHQLVNIAGGYRSIPSNRFEIS